MSGIDDLNFEDLVDGAINTIDEAKTERFAAAKLIKPKARAGSSIVSSKGSATRGTGTGDETIEVLEDTARMDPNAPPDIPGKADQSSFDHIYLRSGVEAGEFTVFRLEDLFNDEDLAALDEKSRVAAVRAILKSHDVDIEAIVEDAVARRAALDSHDNRLKSNIQRVEREMEKENSKLQAEIEEYATPRIERMEKNNERVERLRHDYSEWFERKEDEGARILSILEPWGGDDRLRATERLEIAPPSAPMRAVSGDEAFEPQASVAAPKPVDASVLLAAQADQWDFPAEDPTIEPPSVTKRAASGPRAELADATGDFEYYPPKMRIPRTPVQWLFTLFTIAVACVVAILLAAQLSNVEAAGAILLGIVAAPLLALVPTVASRQRSDFWSGWVVWWCLFLIVGFGFAHLDGANLTTNLTKRPLWFIDEVGLNAEVEEAVHQVTRPYAELVAPILGTEAAIWNPPTAHGAAAPAGE